MRTIVDLTEEQFEQLRGYCEREGISRAEAVRRGVDLLIEEKRRRLDARATALDAAAKTRKDSGIDGLEYERRVRSEWDDR